jgi:hypothetical protein
MELLSVVREAVGFAEPQPDDLVREDELAIVPAIQLQLSTGLRPVTISRWLRVCADSLRRIAETETDWYRTEVMGHFLEQGMSERDMMDAQAEFGSRLTPWNAPAGWSDSIVHRRCASSTSPDTRD